MLTKLEVAPYSIEYHIRQNLIGLVSIPIIHTLTLTINDAVWRNAYWFILLDYFHEYNLESQNA